LVLDFPGIDVLFGVCWICCDWLFVDIFVGCCGWFVCL